VRYSAVLGELLAEARKDCDEWSVLNASRTHERDLARAELASAQQELDALRTVRDQLSLDLTEARRIIAAYEGETP
jgi:hypothetical protein